MYESTTKTVNDVITAVQRQFGDEAEVQLTTSDIIRWINEGQREIFVTNTHVGAAVATTKLVANQGIYPIKEDPALSDLLLIESIDAGGYPLENMTFEQARKYLRETNGTGQPTIWYTRAGILNLYPVPATDVENGLVINYTKAPSVVRSQTDDLSVPDNYYNALLQFVLAQAYEMDETPQMGEMKHSQFEKSLNIQANRTTPQNEVFPTISLELEDIY